MPPVLRIAYFVHDLADAAVARRVTMLCAGGAEVVILGFHRRDGAPTAIAGMKAIDLGRTGDGKLVQRAWQVLRSLAAFGRIRAATRHADVVIARNLEMLVLGARAAAKRRLVYECLDIHRTLLTGGKAGRAIQAIERALLKRVDLILTSSPRFADDYFRRLRKLATPILLLENKVLAIDGPPVPAPPIAPGPPWNIGWFGMLRCRRSLDMLAALVRAGGGAIEVVIAGIPARSEFDDFEASVAATPGIRYVGPYRPADLAALYGQVHFAWAIDYFEEGLNSSWLLPNRLYEAIAFGAVPIALAQVETGAWLRRHAVGAVIDDPVTALPALLAGLTAAEFADMQAALAGLPREALEVGTDDCIALVDRLRAG